MPGSRWPFPIAAFSAKPVMKSTLRSRSLNPGRIRHLAAVHGPRQADIGHEQVDARV